LIFESGTLDVTKITTPMNATRFILDKQLVIMVSLALVLSSCYSYKSITRNEPITKDFLSTLYPGGKYAFDLKSGQTMHIEITSTKNDTIVGVMHQNGIDGVVDYSESFETIERNVARISRWKRDITLTVFAIAVPATLTVVVIATSINSWIDGL
jgi:hypothetical protein